MSATAEAVSDAALDAEAAALEGEHIPASDAAAALGDGEEEGGTSEMIGDMLKAGFDIFAPNWKVTERECKLAGDTYGALLDKYLPGIDIGPELGSVIVTLVIFGPRWNKPRKVEPKEKGGDAPTE